MTEKSSKPMPDIRRLKECLSYDADTGRFQVLVATSNRSRGGHKSGRYWSIGLDGQKYQLHRLAYYYMTGDDPGDMMVDHIDGDTDNNRFSNLQLVTNKQNQDKSRYSNHDKVQVKNGKRTKYGLQLAREAQRQRRKKQGLQHQTTTGETNHGYYMPRFESTNATTDF